MRNVRILLCSHDAVDDKVGATVEYEAKVLECCQGEHPTDDQKDLDKNEEEDDDKDEKKDEGCQQCYTQRRRDNFPGTQFFLDKLLILKKGLGQGTPKQLAELKKKSEFFDGSLSPSGNRPLGEKALSGQMLLELNLSLPFPCV